MSPIPRRSSGADAALTQAARRHRVGTGQVVRVMLDATSVRTYATSKGEAIEWIGAGNRGRELRVIAVVDHEDPDTLWIIHAQPTTYTKGAQS